MKIELIAGQSFVRDAGKTRPLPDVLADLCHQTRELFQAEQKAIRHLSDARHALADALIAGEPLNRNAVQKAEAALMDIRERQQAAREQRDDLARLHAAAITKNTTARIGTELSALAKTYETAIRRLRP